MIYARGNGDTRFVTGAHTAAGEPIIVGFRDGQLMTMTPKHNTTKTGTDRVVIDAGESDLLYVRDKETLTKVRVSDRRGGQQSPSRPQREPRRGISNVLNRDQIVNDTELEPGGTLYSRRYSPGTTPRKPSFLDKIGPGPAAH